MPEYVYELKHMFSGLRKGQTAPTFFTRDNEHQLSELEDKVIEEALAKKWITRTEVPVMAELRDAKHAGSGARSKK